MDIFKGKMLDGKYLIEDLIGVGGMANVYSGFDCTAKRPVAIKILRDEYCQNDDFLRRFRDETRAIATLNHPNIVKIYDVILDAANPAIVMEYVDGITVREYIDRHKDIKFDVAVKMTIELLKALRHAHENGVVHRDIKPQNIMVPGDGTVKVMDFGIAKLAASQTSSKNEAVGSAHYTSPEQARGDMNVDSRSDIYSVGMVLYELTTGRVPFEGDNPIEVAKKQINEIPQLPSKYNPDIPKGLCEIIMHAIEKAPCHRYISAQEMIGDLIAFLKDHNVTFGYRYHKPQKQRPSISIGRKAKEGEKQERSMLSVLFGVMCAFVAATVCFLGFLLIKNNPFYKVPEVMMPNLIGESYNSVIKNKDYKKFRFELVAQEYNSSFEQGEIYDQYPTPNKMVKENTTIKVKVSNGPQLVTLPNFTDDEATLAAAKMLEMGLMSEQILVENDSVREGNIIRTEPGPNETVPLGSTVKMYVSKGSNREKVIVPDVRGQDFESAREVISAAGLVVGTVTRQVSMEPTNTVIAQTPNYPAPIAMGSKVNLTIASDEVGVEENRNFEILCLLPMDINDIVDLAVEQDGVVVLNQMIVPSDSRVVSISVPGDGGYSIVEVKLDDKLYMSYKVDFTGDRPRHSVITDNSKDFKLDK